MTCPTETYRDRRVIHALRPTPIVRGIAKPARIAQFLPSWWVVLPPLVLAKALGVL